MRLALFPALLLLTACRQDSLTAAENVTATIVDSPCKREMFEGSPFTVCSERGGPIEVRGGARSFAALEIPPDRVAFAMNAGMFDENGRAIGLLIEDGREVKGLNRRRGGGNFHLMPNGVFLLRKNGVAEVRATSEYRPDKDIAFATQSGPMLVIDGKLHPKFDRDGQSRYIRNGVGIAPDETATFVISDEPVSFGRFARFFRDEVGAKDALYFDGSVSSLWNPTAGRQDSFAELGPIVIVFRKGAP